MPANQFGRYVWLVDTLRRHKHLSHKEISQKWEQSGLSYGEGDELPLRTFHNHRKAIADIFNIYIEIDSEVKGYKYHISNPQDLEGNSLRSWLIDSYATLNQIQADSKLQNRIEFENIPSGNLWLSVFIEAMRNNMTMQITHKGFGKEYANTFEIEPYCLKVVARRWYIIAHNPYYAMLNQKYAGKEGYVPRPEIRAYGLDRILQASILDKPFVYNEDFNIQTYYEGCAGIIPSNDPIERVVIVAYRQGADYLRTLPLHQSQQELEHDEESTTFAYDVKVTYDFMQLVFQMGDQVEVLEPQSFRDAMRRHAQTLMSYYKPESIIGSL